MPEHASHQPRHVPQVMVSSTFLDLAEHRAAMIQAIHKHKLHANVMEHDDARLSHDVIDSSLHMVRDSAAYILVISLKYGQTPACPDRNPSQLSITELEFNEAQRLERPILLFIMGDKHPGTKDDFERDPAKEPKLNAFRERAKKKMRSSVPLSHLNADCHEIERSQAAWPATNLIRAASCCTLHNVRRIS